MPAQTVVQQHQRQLMELRSLADADLSALLRLLGDGSVADIRDALIDAVPELIDPYLVASGELAAVLFEDLRAEAGRRGTFYAEAAPVALPPERVSSTVRWAVAPLADESLGGSVLTRLGGSFSRMIMDSSRDTMYANGGREQVRFQRMPRPGCCSFCGMLASRPPYMAYRSEASAGGVVGRGSTRSGVDASGRSLSGGRGKGVRARGRREVGASTHDDCHCVVVPLYPGTAMTRLAGVERRKYEEMYQQALTDENGNSVRGTKDILANWRATHGTH